jgi:hypothetical protein
MYRIRNIVRLAATSAGIAGVLAFLPASQALAHGGGGMSGANGNFGGQSSSHISSEAVIHSNGPNATDRDFGVVHARSHMSAKGLKHSKAVLHSRTAVDADGDSDDVSTTSRVRR